MGIENYITTIQAYGEKSNNDELLLWPGTPKTRTLQDQIKKSVGVEDDINNTGSRTYRIYKEMTRLLGNNCSGGGEN